MCLTWIWHSKMSCIPRFIRDDDDDDGCCCAVFCLYLFLYLIFLDSYVCIVSRNYVFHSSWSHSGVRLTKNDFFFRPQLCFIVDWNNVIKQNKQLRAKKKPFYSLSDFVFFISFVHSLSSLNEIFRTCQIWICVLRFHNFVEW